MLAGVWPLGGVGHLGRGEPGVGRGWVRPGLQVLDTLSLQGPGRGDFSDEGQPPTSQNL